MTTMFVFPLFTFVCLYLVRPVPVPLFGLPVSPEFCYRPGLSAVSEDGCAPTRPLPPTPDDDDALDPHADRTLVKRVSTPCLHMCYTFF